MSEKKIIKPIDLGPGAPIIYTPGGVVGKMFASPDDDPTFSVLSDDRDPSSQSGKPISRRQALGSTEPLKVAKQPSTDNKQDTAAEDMGVIDLAKRIKLRPPSDN